MINAKITYTLSGKTTTHKYKDDASAIDPVVARAMATYKAAEAERAYESALAVSQADPDDASLLRAVERAYANSMAACNAARQLERED